MMQEHRVVVVGRDVPVPLVRGGARVRRPYGLVELDRYGVPATPTDGGESVGFDA